MHSLLGSTNSPLFLKINCKLHIACCHTALGWLHCISINSSQTFIFVASFCSSPIFLFAVIPSISTGSATSAKVSGSQNPVSRLINQHQFVLSEQLRPFVPRFFLCHVAMLGATYQLVEGKQISWRHSSPPESLRFGTPLPY